METENNVVTINGQEYIEDNLNEGQRYFINQIRDLQLKANSLRFQLDQVVVAQDKFTEELIKTVEVVEEQEEEFPSHDLIFWKWTYYSFLFYRYIHRSKCKKSYD